MSAIDLGASPGGWTWQWPGLYFETAFAGSEAVFEVGAGATILHVDVDGRRAATLARPAPGLYRISGLAGNRPHIIERTGFHPPTPNHIGIKQTVFNRSFQPNARQTGIKRGVLTGQHQDITQLLRTHTCGARQTGTIAHNQTAVTQADRLQNSMRFLCALLQTRRTMLLLGQIQINLPRHDIIAVKIHVLEHGG